MKRLVLIVAGLGLLLVAKWAVTTFIFQVVGMS